MHRPRMTFLDLVQVLALGSLCAYPVLDAAGHERQANDGWYNNLIHPDWGAVDTQLLRKTAANYSDGVYQPSGKDRPNPLLISDVAFKGDNAKSSLRNRSAMLVFFGQQLVEEMVDSQRRGCPREFFNIPVPPHHRYNPKNLDNLQMPFYRSRYDQRTGFSPGNPRQQLNEITPYLDGNLVYGHGKAVEDALRSFEDGLLLSTSDRVQESFPPKNNIRLPFANPPPPRDHTLKPVSRFRMFGNPRTHENPFLASLAVVWFRYHNYLARQFKGRHADWTDEQLFLASRKRLIAQYQKITMYEWLPLWLSINNSREVIDFKAIYPYKGKDLNPFFGYNPNIHPGISAEFQVAAMRYGHTLVPSVVIPQKVERNFCKSAKRKVANKYTNSTNVTDRYVELDAIRLCNSYFLPEESLEGEPGITAVIRGMVMTKAAREDNVIVSDLREEVFGPLDWSRRDLGALNIQRGRDHGLPNYNDVREAFGLKRHGAWKEINSYYSEVFDELSKLYNDSTPDNLDVFVGGLLETTPNGPGELFKRIIIDQFLRIRHGDRFWYENYETNKLFTKEEVEEIERTTFRDVLNSVIDNLDIGSNTNVFLCTKSSVQDCNCKEPISKSRIQEKCVSLERYDYFDGSRVWYTLTVILILISVPAVIGIMVYIAKKRQSEIAASTQKHYLDDPDRDAHHFYASEWIGKTHYGTVSSREVLIDLISNGQKILLSDFKGTCLRMVDLRGAAQSIHRVSVVDVTLSCDKGYRLLLLAISGEIDLVLHFPTQHERDVANQHFKDFFESHNWKYSLTQPKAENVMWKEAFTVEQRKEELARFFRGIVKDLSNRPLSHSVYDKNEDILNTQLTRSEFADALGLQPQSLFVRNMFHLVDTNNNGFVSFNEFKKYFGIFCAGTHDQKAKMFFKMFGRDGKLTKENYAKMIRAFKELTDSKEVSPSVVDAMVDAVFKQRGCDARGYFTYGDFKEALITDIADVWNSAIMNLDLNGENIHLFDERKSVLQRATSLVATYKRPRQLVKSMSIATTSAANSLATQESDKSEHRSWTSRYSQYLLNHWRPIFWCTLYTSVTCGIFVERAQYFATEREHYGLRKIVGYGVSITRGAASAQMFTFASLLITMCRNSITVLRDTWLNAFIPFDYAYDMHIYIAWMAVFFSVVHVVGHLFNFYNVSTQASLDMNCYFREFFRSTDQLASFQYWTWTTITGIFGVLLTLMIVVMSVFAIPYARRFAFNAFALTHKLYIFVYVCLFLHGAGRLVQQPFWGYFCVGPTIVFLLDKLVSIRRKTLVIPVLRATLLPSGVINLVLKRPFDFKYQSGQWIRIALKELGKGEYHPFTLTSAPHENNLSLHIRAVGPWTTNLCQLFNPLQVNGLKNAKVYVDGPFGESHQDWYQYPVSVLIGGGIGVTPFASILKDVAYRCKDQKLRIPCQKVYFLWVTRTQKNFEWMTDILHEVESADTEDLVGIHICITQIKDKFDMRTAMMYICERHFQKVAGVSMFTGLRAKTHFGRPKFNAFFRTLKDQHNWIDRIGIFSCGPPAMSRSVELTCSEENAKVGPTLIHHFKNF